MTVATPTTCTCGARYADLRTGLTFAIVRQMMWTGDPDPSTWRYRDRRRVLGFWREMKINLWHAMHGYCAAQLEPAYEAAPRAA